MDRRETNPISKASWARAGYAEHSIKFDMEPTPSYLYTSVLSLYQLVILYSTHASTAVGIDSTTHTHDSNGPTVDSPASTKERDDGYSQLTLFLPWGVAARCPVHTRDL